MRTFIGNIAIRVGVWLFVLNCDYTQEKDYRKEKYHEMLDCRSFIQQLFCSHSDFTHFFTMQEEI